MAAREGDILTTSGETVINSSAPQRTGIYCVRAFKVYGNVLILSTSPSFEVTTTLQEEQDSNETNQQEDSDVSNETNQSQSAGAWNGVWKIDMGMLALTQTGNSVSGTFGEWDDNFAINGVANGNKVSGSIDIIGEPGKFEFQVSPDGSMSGWCRPDGYEDWEDSIEWVGVKAADSFGTTDTAWGGTWYTDFGPMVLMQNGGNINGVYRVYTDTPIFQIQGTASGNSFTGTVREGEFVGSFEFNLASDGKSFTGQYRYRGEDEWTDWNGVKKK